MFPLQTSPWQWLDNWTVDPCEVVAARTSATTLRQTKSTMAATETRGACLAGAGAPIGQASSPIEMYQDPVKSATLSLMSIAAHIAIDELSESHVLCLVALRRNVTRLRLQV